MYRRLLAAAVWISACTDPVPLVVDAAMPVDAAVPVDAAALDANADASAPDAATPAGLRVFVTSGDYAASEVGAEGLCDAVAAAAAVGGRWTAWLAFGGRGGGERIQGDGPWVDLTGALVFPDRAAFATGPVKRLRVDERGQEAPVSSPAWTGTSGDGTSTGNTCQDWSTNAQAASGTRGAVGEGNSEWTRRATSAACSDRGRVYCFERRDP